MNIKNLFLVSLAWTSFTASAQEVAINANELPAPATQFLDTHFKGNPISSIIKDTEGKKITYEVKLQNGTEIEFSQKGKWKEVDGKKNVIPTAYIPQSILDYVKTNYPKEHITQIDKGHRDYDVDLSNGIDLEFDLKGKFLRVDK